jgi:hypothetical protein
MNETERSSKTSDQEEAVHMPDDSVLIASLLRDKKTGRLLVSINERHYSRAADIDDPEARSRLEYAASDLRRWLATPASSKQASMDTSPLEADSMATKPLSMIDAINAILERWAAEGKASKGLRLYEAPDGTARVFVGVNSYEVDKVPDKQTRDLIKEAVAEWEAHQ